MHRIPAVESQRIDDISNTVMKAKAAVEDRVDRLENERLARIDETSSSALSEARMTRQTIHGHHDIMMRAIGDITARQRELRLPDDQAMKDILKECFQEVLASTMQTGFYRLVEETEYCKSKCPLLVDCPPTHVSGARFRDRLLQQRGHRQVYED